MLSVTSDVAGQEITLRYNGQSMKFLSRADAQQAVDYITFTLIQLRHDDIVKRQIEELKETYER